MDRTVVELRQELGHHGLKTSGNKPELVARLAQYEQQQLQDDDLDSASNCGSHVSCTSSVSSATRLKLNQLTAEEQQKHLRRRRELRKQMRAAQQAAQQKAMAAANVQEDLQDQMEEEDMQHKVNVSRLAAQTVNSHEQNLHAQLMQQARNHALPPSPSTSRDEDDDQVFSSQYVEYDRDEQPTYQQKQAFLAQHEEFARGTSAPSNVLSVTVSDQATGGDARTTAARGSASSLVVTMQDGQWAPYGGTQAAGVDRRRHFSAGNKPLHSDFIISAPRKQHVSGKVNIQAQSPQTRATPVSAPAPAPAQQNAVSQSARTTAQPVSARPRAPASRALKCNQPVNNQTTALRAQAPSWWPGSDPAQRPVTKHQSTTTAQSAYHSQGAQSAYHSQGAQSAYHSQGVQSSPPAAVAGSESSSARYYEHMLPQLMELMSMPKPTLATFDGDPMQYSLFINSFCTAVDRTSISAAAKLTRLLDVCKGKAREVIAPCALLDPEEGYREAHTLLRERFGNDFVIADAWVTKITAGGQLPGFDAPALRNFTDQVRSCFRTLGALGQLGEIETRTVMAKLAARLPNHMMNTWRKEAVTALDLHGKYPRMSVFLAFLEKNARQAADPIFGYRAQSKSDNKGRDNKRNGATGGRPQVASLAVDAKPVVTNPPASKSTTPAAHSAHSGQKTRDYKLPPCKQCKGDHYLFHCDVYKALSSDERLTAAKSFHVCFNCLKPGGHSAKECRSRDVCSVNACGKRHHSLIHEALAKNRRPPAADGNVPTVNNIVVNTVSSNESAKCALPIVSVYVSSNDSKHSILTYALLDTGSNRSFCDESLLSQLSIQAPRSDVCVSTLGGGSSLATRKVSLVVRGDGTASDMLELPHVFTVEQFPKLDHCVATADDVRAFTHLQSLCLPADSRARVRLLIGQDNSHALLPLEVRRGEKHEPYAVKTPLGWTINGPLRVSDDAISCHQIDSYGDARLAESVERFWRIDQVTCIGPALSLSQEDRRALKIWDQSVEVVNGHYQLDIPFRHSNPQLPDSRVMAEKRLDSLMRKLERDETLRVKYTQSMEDLISKGFAEPAPEQCTPGMTWYIPHHAVLNPNKPGKLRVVFDCAARVAGKSLNTEVLQGPDLTNRLLGVLLRFREGPVGIMADVEAMFHQVRVSPEHRDALRFLWRDAQGIVNTYRMCVHLFGGIWSPSVSTFALQYTAREFKDRYPLEVIEAILREFYVDDLLKAVLDDATAINFYKNITSLLKLRGFNLTKWASSSRAVLEAIEPGHRAPALQEIDLQSGDLPADSTLGVGWNTQKDKLFIKTRQPKIVFTKRGLLSTLSSLYDPIGLIAPYILLAKKLFQAETRAGKDWDEPVSDATRTALLDWARDIYLLQSVSVPRFQGPSFAAVNTQLHHFADASTAAYGTVSYMRYEAADGEVHCSFLYGKSRLAPLKELSIVRLELCAALTAANVNITLSKELRHQPDTVHYWSDSTSVLGYINNMTRRYNPFVAHRLTQIHDVSVPAQWRHVPGVLNPADKASRGTTDLGKDWLQAPSFLLLPAVDWPCVVDPSKLQLDENDKEVKALVTLTAAPEEREPSMFTPLVEYHNQWSKLVTKVGWVMRAYACFKGIKPAASALSFKDRSSAETHLILIAQDAAYRDQIADVKENIELPKGHPLHSLEPLLDEQNRLRAGGRLSRAAVSADVKNPIIMPAGHRITQLLVEHYHASVAGHGGSEYTLSVLRQRFWVPRARGLVKRVINNCLVCKRLQAKAALQQMAALPIERVTSHLPPFSHTGVDCFGPFNVRYGRGTKKRYGCIFTCMATRAIHLEMLEEMNTSSFISGLRRFICRRGRPLSIRSDNGTNFVGAQAELERTVKEWNESAHLQDYLTQQSIEWCFNTPAASHHGGVWERMIRSVRRTLDSALKSNALTDEDLRTVLCEAEACVNGRPLTKVSTDVNDNVPLTPSDLLIARSSATLPPTRVEQGCRYQKRWRNVQLVVDCFWRRWVDEYLPLLRQRQKWLTARRNLAVGDLVLVMQGEVRRNEWPLALVVDTHPGDDGLVRSATIKMHNKEYKRPVVKLCLLEAAPNTTE